MVKTKYPNKAQSDGDNKGKGSRPAEVKRSYNFPKQGIVVQASSREEAERIVASQASPRSAESDEE